MMQVSDTIAVKPHCEPKNVPIFSTILFVMVYVLSGWLQIKSNQIKYIFQ